MNQSQSGTEFAAKVAETTGQELENPEIVADLFETCEREGMMSSFKDLALCAKSFQKVARLLSTDRSNDDMKRSAKTELEGFLKNFSNTVEKIVFRLPPEKQKDYQTNFLLPTPGSFRNLRALLNDFVKVKDYMLAERDRGTTK